jgi:hypothetical protein
MRAEQRPQEAWPEAARYGMDMSVFGYPCRFVAHERGSIFGRMRVSGPECVASPFIMEPLLVGLTLGPR